MYTVLVMYSATSIFSLHCAIFSNIRFVLLDFHSENDAFASRDKMTPANMQKSKKQISVITDCSITHGDMSNPNYVCQREITVVLFSTLGSNEKIELWLRFYGVQATEQ